jgi:hypothetical protein
MSIELITSALLNVSGVTVLVGDRRALSQLPQGAAMPAVVYEGISTTPQLTMNAASGPQLLISRVQITALALNPGDVAAILTAVMAALNLKSGTYAGKQVASVIRDIKTSITKDNDAGVWYGSQDFMVHWYE